MTSLTISDAKTPWHLWVVGIVGILWNAYGGYDYTMTELYGVTYLHGAGMTGAQIAYFTAMPPWMIGVWAVGVWGAILGSVLLLLKMKWAWPVFIASLAGFLMSLVYAYGLSNGSKVMPQSTAVLNVIILAGCLFFVWYSRMMTWRGILH